jgi:hypothetical protein
VKASPIPQDPTLQEVFDHVARHLLRQGEPCKDPETETCLLVRGAHRCAVGSLLGPTQAAKIEQIHGNAAGIQSQTVEGLVADSLGLESLDDDAVELLEALQDIHDTDEVEAWPTALTGLADAWGFDPSAIDEVRT